MLSAYRAWLLAGSGAVMLVFWGYSSDGLGRNCLEPVAVLLIIYAAGLRAPSWPGWQWLFVLTAIEAMAVRGIGIMCAASVLVCFRWH